MKALSALVLALLASIAPSANSAPVNQFLPYPPGCARIPDLAAPESIEDQAVKFFDREVMFYGSQAGEEIPLNLRVFRVPCSETNRSLIWLEFILAAQFADQELAILLPTAAVEIAPDYRKLMNLATEPNGWGSGGWVDREARYLSSKLQGLRWYYGTPGGERRWVFLLDNTPPFPEEFYEGGLTPTEYNAAFKLVLRYNPYDFLVIDVPATGEILDFESPDMPLSGRHSGNWVIPGTSDQGILLSISELVAPEWDDDVASLEMPMLVFLAHYTFDQEGRMLWLTGAAEFGPNTQSVTIPIERSTNGEFRGGRRADREVVGSVTLESRSCDDLSFQYDYSAIGLGSGRRPLRRLFSMETAGHECLDFEARAVANP